MKKIRFLFESLVLSLEKIFRRDKKKKINPFRSNHNPTPRVEKREKK